MNEDFFQSDMNFKKKSEKLSTQTAQLKLIEGSTVQTNKGTYTISKVWWLNGKVYEVVLNNGMAFTGVKFKEYLDGGKVWITKIPMI